MSQLDNEHGQKQIQQNDNDFVKANQDVKPLEKTLSTYETIMILQKTALPITMSCCFFYFIILTNMVWVGTLDDIKLLAGVGTGNMLFNIFGFSVYQGFNGTQESFIPQTLGSGKKRECGIVFNRAKLINFIVFIPIAILMLSSEKILLLCAQDPEISRIAMLYCVVSLPGTLAL